MPSIFEERVAGHGIPTVFLHGAGHNAAVWDGLRACLSPEDGECIFLDLPGHGRSAPLESYALGGQAAVLAEILPPDIHLVGHSLGGALGLLLASRLFGARVVSLFIIGLKVVWTDEERARMSRIYPVKPFARREDAAERLLRLSGLQTLIGPEHRFIDLGLSRSDDAYRLAADPRAALAALTPIEPVLALRSTSDTPICFANGSEDEIAPLSPALKLSPDLVILNNCGHSAHVENPIYVMNAYRLFRSTLPRE